MMQEWLGDVKNMNYSDIEFNSMLGSSIKVYPTKYPNIPAAAEKISEVDIPGRDGVLKTRTGKYESTQIPIEFNYIGKEELWNERWRKVKQWLSATDAELSIADDSEFYYRISRVILDTNERVSRRIGKFTATFVTKDGLSYYKSGKSKMSIEDVKCNPGITSQPIYIITGEGFCELTVNGKTMKVNVSENIVINTELMVSYHTDNTSQNTAVNGDYEELYLHEGNNEISITDGFECKIIPNWRCL